MDFKINSQLFKVFLWTALVLVLTSDFYALWTLYTSNTSLGLIPKTITALGIGIKLGVLYCLITFNGPIKGLLYTWGSLFILSGALGLLAFMLSPEVEPVQNYLDKGLFLAVGLLLVIPASKCINYVQQNEA